MSDGDMEIFKVHHRIGEKYEVFNAESYEQKPDCWKVHTGPKAADPISVSSLGLSLGQA